MQHSIYRQKLTSRICRFTFPSKAESAVSASSLVAKETNPYPADLPEGLSKTTLAETGLKFSENSSRRWVDLAFHARLET